jgi:hypothetical protein
MVPVRAFVGEQGQEAGIDRNERHGVGLLALIYTFGSNAHAKLATGGPAALQPARNERALSM